MRPRLPVVVAGVLLALVGPVTGPALAAPTPSTPTTPTAAAAAAHEVVVTGEGVGTFPVFTPAVSRYALTTSAATGGQITVTATSDDPAATVWVNGVLAPTGARTVTGLAPGDEVAVFVDDGDGRSAYSYVYLPDDFPELVRSGTSAPTHEHVMLTLGHYLNPDAPFFETALDANGVPALLMTNRNSSSMDLKLQPNGHYSVARGSGNPAYPDAAIVELDEQFQEVGSYRTVGLGHTDGHDAILLDDGSRYLLAYEDDGAGRLDAVVQHIDAAGDLQFSWNSGDHVAADESVVPSSNPDYAHINSIQVMSDGNLLLSFRHLSAVLKVARHDGGGFEEGQVMWRLGGRDSDFAFETAAGDSDVGPCAQHTATELPNGHIMVFDNGSDAFAQELCVDPADPDGDPVGRTPTRIVEWSLEEPTEEETGVATVVRDHTVDRTTGEPGGRWAIFAGSAQPLENGGAMVGWASATDTIASELGPDGAVRWELADAAEPASARTFSYRAFALDLPDATDPVVSVDLPVSGATVVEGDRVDPGLECSDRGGSSLQTCDVTAVDTRSPGVRTLTAVARDGAGNLTTLTRRYRVVARHRPDALIRAAGSARLVGKDRYGAAPRQQLRITRSRGSFLAVVRVRNAGAGVDRVRLTPTLRSRKFTVRPAGARTSPLLRPGQSWTTTVRVVPRSSVRRGDRAVVRLEARSSRNSRRVDTVWLVARRS